MLTLPSKLVRRSQVTKVTLGAVGAMTALFALAACAKPFPQPGVQSSGPHSASEPDSRAGSFVNRAKNALPANERGARVLSGVLGGLGALGERSRSGESTLEQLLRRGEGDARVVRGNGLCPPDMATIGDRFCVDRFEASLVEVLPNGEERSISAYETVDGRVVRAISERGVVPQAYISGKEAAQACGRSGKRLCKPNEWRQACMGPSSKQWGYGEKRERGKCNDHGRSAMGVLYGAGRDGDRTYWNMTRMNNPELNKLACTLAKTGEHESCTNEYGVYDMVGNLHEWVDDKSGTFQGGYYLDVTQNGDGCGYKTRAHENWYHDYSTGFRCCADVAP